MKEKINKKIEFNSKIKRTMVVTSLIAVLEIIAFLCMPYAYKVFIDGITEGMEIRRIYLALIIYFLTVMAGCIFGFIKNLLSNVVIENIVKDIRMWIFSKVRQASLKKLDQHNKGKLMSIILNDTRAYSNVYGNVIFSVIQNIVRIAVAIVILGSINIKMLVIIVALLPIYLMDGIVFNKPIKKYSRKIQEQNEVITDTINEELHGTMDILVMNKIQWEKNKLKDIFNKYIKFSFKNKVWTSISSDLGFIIYWLIHILVLVMGVKPVLNGEMSFGTLVLYAQYIDNIYMPCKLLIQDNINYQSSIVSKERILSLTESLENENSLNRTETLKEFSEEIRFQGVSFKHEDKDIIKNISFTLRKGECIALLGASGAGKSTVLKLLLNLYEPDEGKIFIDSKDISTIKSESLYEHMSVVFQDTFLLDDSIYENIAFGKSNAEREAVLKAAAKAAVDKMIHKDKTIYSMEVGERGGKLSGGEKQRISIARALLKESEILIFDEPTSALDKKTKQQILHTINKLKNENKTILLVTHDMENLEVVDRVIQLEEGVIV